MDSQTSVVRLVQGFPSVASSLALLGRWTHGCDTHNLILKPHSVPTSLVIVGSKGDRMTSVVWFVQLGLLVHWWWPCFTRPLGAALQYKKGITIHNQRWTKRQAWFVLNRAFGPSPVALLCSAAGCRCYGTKTFKGVTMHNQISRPHSANCWSFGIKFQDLTQCTTGCLKLKHVPQRPAAVWFNWYSAFGPALVALLCLATDRNALTEWPACQRHQSKITLSDLSYIHTHMHTYIHPYT